ncbi:MarR family winged helix-turn-helix transcriptional regulator [Seohaeicola zhoushanensis]|uniref:MarR family transcriptional regulator n=1 Tax=Seohaeicola zhoushanensis TaxID=1569283 RepID=A0A8J3GWZ7_9RHOB|nr:MarR family transcriptional regulator [Seohaeicola zhoushanensis]GHF51272.1 MarR family transcriptional regulator [Seohaeicola zhoushanensis]
MREDLPIDVTHEVRDSCLCLHLQRAARAVGRRFDEALRPVGLSHGQFSLLISLNRPEAPRLGDVARLLGMDRTTLTANLKPLERRGLLTVSPDPSDRRGRRLALTPDGEDLLVQAVPVWRQTLAQLPPVDLLGGLAQLVGMAPETAGTPDGKAG